MRFHNRSVLVTGAGSGIGVAAAQRLAQEGARVTLVGRDRAGLERTASGISEAFVVVADVSDPQRVADAFDAAVERFGRIDSVVHAAGVDDPEAKQEIGAAIESGRPVDVTAQLTDDRWRTSLSVNLDGTFYVLRAALRAMRRAGKGTVVVVGSASAIEATLGLPHYAAAKAGVHALVQSVAKEAIGFGVRVDVVAPGPTATAMTERIPPPMLTAILAAGRRFASPHDIAATIAFLASEESSDLVGSVVVSNGGRFTR